MNKTNPVLTSLNSQYSRTGTGVGTQALRGSSRFSWRDDDSQAHPVEPGNGRGVRDDLSEDNTRAESRRTGEPGIGWEHVWKETLWGLWFQYVKITAVKHHPIEI